MAKHGLSRRLLYLPQMNAGSDGGGEDRDEKVVHTAEDMKLEENLLSVRRGTRHRYKIVSQISIQNLMTSWVMMTIMMMVH